MGKKMRVYRHQSQEELKGLFTHYGFWAGLLQAAHGHAMPLQPQRASLHGRISAVWFGSVGGDEFDFGWGTDPQTPDFMYFYVFLCICSNIHKLISPTPQVPGNVTGLVRRSMGGEKKEKGEKKKRCSTFRVGRHIRVRQSSSEVRS